jgi:hypothetical protein
MEESFLSAKNVLSTILLNQDTSIILDELILNHLTLNPSLITKYINEKGLYHVYYKLWFPEYNDRNRITDDSPILIKSFGSEIEAKNWIIRNGNNIVNEKDGYFGCTGVLFISKQHNETDSFDEYFNSMAKYQTFVFSNKASEVLIDEYVKSQCKSELEYWAYIKPAIEDLDWVTVINTT